MAKNKQRKESSENQQLLQVVSNGASAEQLQQNPIKKEPRSDGEFSNETLTGQLPYTLTNDFPEILYSEYFLYNLQTGHKYSDKFAIYMLQLNQLGNPKDERDIPEIYYWAQLFKAKTWEEIQMLAEKNECIKQSIVTLQEITADEKARMQMEARERYRRDLAASVELGKQQSAEVIQKIQAEKEKAEEKCKQLEEKSEKDEEEKKQMEQRIRYLEAQLAQAEKQDK